MPAVCVSKPLLIPSAVIRAIYFAKNVYMKVFSLKKKDIKRQKKLFEAQQKQIKEQEELDMQKSKTAEIAAFDKIETGILPQKHDVFRPLNEDGTTSAAPRGVVVGGDGGTTTANALALVVRPVVAVAGEPKMPTTTFEEELKLNAFWVPSLTPSAAAKRLEMPSKDPLCKEGNHPLRLKQLVIVRFTPNTKDTDTEDPNHVRTARYCCPVCRRTLTDAPKAVLLKTCGHVHCLSCCEKFANERICTVCDKPYKEADMIRLQSGGTGYSGHDDNIIARKVTPAPWL